MKSQLQGSIDESLAGLHLLDHPFYRRWEAGKLAREELKSYAEQYRFFEAMLPDFLRSLSGKLDNKDARDAVLANLSDEVGPPSHLKLFDDFAHFYGASTEPISPAMQVLIDAYSRVLQRGPSAALAGLLAYESQGAGIADSKAEGLAQHYGASSDAAAFWVVHGTAEKDHANWTSDALASLEPNLDEVQLAAHDVAQAWWAFLDERESIAA